jgi:C-terminal processing protease CtpA/Prc
MHIHRLLLAVTLSSVACAMTGPRFDLSSLDREKAQRQYVGRDFVLASSMYVSDFFGEKDRLFADPRPFEIIELFHESGKPVVIGLASETIVPAGTPVVVKQLVYPLDQLQATFKTQGSELLPTGHPWVVVERTDPAASKTPLVIVLPRQIGNLEQFGKAFQERLKSQQWVTTWLTQRDPSTLDKIFRKEVGVGMTWVDVTAALGEPKNLGDKNKEMTAFVADFGDIQVTVTGNIVKEVKSIKAEAAVATKQAQEAADAARAEAEKRRAEDEARRAVAEEARKKAEEEGAKARAEIMAKAEAERQGELARKEEDRKKLAGEEDKLRKEAELKARMDAATKAKEDVQTEKERRVKEAALAKLVAQAEAEALVAQKKADKEAAKAEAEALAARKKFQKQLTGVEAEAQKARKKAEAVENDAITLKEKLDTQRQEIERLSGDLAGPRKIGAKVQPISLQLAGALGLSNTNGAFIAEVAADGEGARAGLKSNDIVLDVDGKEVTDPKSFVELVAASDKARAVALGVFRGGTRVGVKLEGAPTSAMLERDMQTVKKGETELAAKEKLAVQVRADAENKARAVAKVRADFMKKYGAERRKIGVKVEALSEQLAAALAVPGKGGAYIVEVRPDTEAAKAGLEKNDVILRANGVPTDSPDAFAELVGNTLPTDTVDLDVVRKGKRLTVSIVGDANATVKVGGASPAVTQPTAPAVTTSADGGRVPVAGGRAPPDPRKVEMADVPADGESDVARKPVK